MGLALVCLVIAVFLPLASFALHAVGWPDAVDLDPLRRAMGRGRVWRILLVTLQVALPAAAAATAAGAAAGWCLARTGLPGLSLWGLGMAATFALPPYLTAVAWKQIAAPGGWLSAAGLPVTGAAVASAILALWLTPLTTLIAWDAFRRGQGDSEAAALLSRGPWEAFLHVTLPAALPSLRLAGAVAFVLAAVNYGVPDLLEVHVYPVEIFTQFSAFHDIPAAAAATLPLAALLVAVWWMATSRNPSRGRVDGQGGATLLPRFRLSPAQAFLTSLFLSLIVVPGAVLPLLGFAVEAGGADAYSRTWRLASADFLFTGKLALSGAALLTLAGAGLALVLRYSGARRSGTLLRTLAYAPFFVPPSVLGIALIEHWNQPFYPALMHGTPVALGVGLCLRFLPFSLACGEKALERIDTEMEEAAWACGVSPSRTTAGILFPLYLPSLLAVFSLGLVLVLGEVDLSVLLAPPGSSPVIIRIFNFLHYGMDRTLAASCVLLTAGLLATAVLLSATGRWALGPATEGGVRTGRSG